MGLLSHDVKCVVKLQDGIAPELKSISDILVTLSVHLSPQQPSIIRLFANRKTGNVG